MEIKRVVREFCEKEFDPDMTLELNGREKFSMEQIWENVDRRGI